VNSVQNVKYGRLVSPEAIKDNGSYTSQALDTLGAWYCTIVAHLGATDIAMTALKVQECDTSGGSYVDVTGLIFGTSTNTAGDTSALPLATDDNDFFVFQFPVGGARKRYVKIVATFDDGTVGGFCTVIGLLSRMEQTPSTAAEAGCNQILRI
jgi:hypothetical protein